MSTEFPSKNGIDRKWHVIDADGVVRGKLASKAAMLLMGKHKPTYTPFLDTGDHVVVINASKVHLTGRKEDQKVYRITMTAPLINLARHVAFLVYGEGKAIAVHHIIEDKTNIEEYPAQLIKPQSGDLQWFLDMGAAAQLQRK